MIQQRRADEVPEVEIKGPSQSIATNDALNANEAKDSSSSMTREDRVKTLKGKIGKCMEMMPYQPPGEAVKKQQSTLRGWCCFSFSGGGTDDLPPALFNKAALILQD